MVHVLFFDVIGAPPENIFVNSILIEENGQPLREGYWNVLLFLN
jgi:hypothetical protein